MFYIFYVNRRMIPQLEGNLLYKLKSDNRESLSRDIWKKDVFTTVLTGLDERDINKC